ncbi:MAG TPA: hypothetical protein ENI87_15675 [bacterium]|nr:hypothetical protein [bacterium]
MTTPFATFLRAICMSLALVSLPAQTVTGRVVDTAGVPIPNVTVDAGSGSVPGVTDLLGNFTLIGAPTGVRDIEYVPAAGDPYAARVIETVIGVVTNVGDITLQPGFEIIGVATDPNGVGLFRCNLNVYAQDGTKLFTPYDNTDLFGNFAVMVPAGTWDVRVQPPVGALFVSSTLEDIVVGSPGSTNVGTVQLRTGYLITGSVVDAQTGLPIANTKIKAFDTLTGERFVLLPSEHTNVFGQFSFLLPYSFSHLLFEAPAGNTHVSRQMFGVPIPGPTVLGAVGLENGVLLSGTVLGNGAPVAGADIDVLLADGTKVFTPRDTTDATGAFTVAVPNATAVQVRVEPNASVGLVGTVTPALTTAGPTSLGQITLASGIAVSGVVTGQGTPEAAASVRFFDALGNRLVTVGSRTDAAGQYQTWVPSGTYDVEVVTTDGSFFLDAQQILTVTAPMTQDFTLSSKSFRTLLDGHGIHTTAPGGTVPISVLLHSLAPGFQTVRIDLFIDLLDGTSVPLVSDLTLSLLPVAFTVGPLFVPTVPVPPSLLGKPAEMRVRIRDAGGNNVLDESTSTFYIE